MKTTPSNLAECLIRKGYNKELSANYISNEYLRSGFSQKWSKQTIEDIKICIVEIERGIK
jgi:hypothetical protein